MRPSRAADHPFLDELRASAGVAFGGGVALAALLASCQFSYDNPAEKLQAGQVSGRTVADLGVSGELQPAAGVSVSVKGSAFDQVTHDTGRFIMIPLPAGHHTLLFRQGTEYALTRSVSVELGPDGQPDGVSLGDVVVPFGGSVRARIVGEDSVLAGTAVDEATGLTAVAPGHFQMDALSLGEHAFKFGLVNFDDDEWVGGPVVVRLAPSDQSSVVSLANVVVRRATSSTGRVRFRLVSLHPGIAPGDMVVTVTEQVRGVIPPASLPAPDAHGWIEADLPEGIYRVAIAPPGPLAGAVRAPPPATAIAIHGQVADLGSLYLVPPEVPAAAQFLCVANDDCGKAGTCAGGTCSRGWTPAPGAPASLPLCPAPDACNLGTPCTDDAGQSGFCLVVGGATYATCIACGMGGCTADGINVTAPSASCP